MKVEIWSDFVCPFCYLGERKFELALAEFEHKEEVEISFRSFQLDPNATRHEEEDIHQLIAKKYGMTYEESKANNDQIVRAAAEVGLNYRFDILKPNNTAAAHQAAKFARKLGSEKVFIDRLFRAYFEEGADLGDLSVLLKLAEEVGIEREELEDHLKNESFLAEILEDQEQAKALGINGVPFFVINDKYTVYGAQSVDHFKQILNKAY